MYGEVLTNLKDLFVRYRAGTSLLPPSLPLSWLLAIHLFNGEIGLKDPKGCLMLLKVTCHFLSWEGGAQQD